MSEGDPVVGAEAHVEEHRVDILLRNQTDRADTVRRLQHAIAGVGQDGGEQRANAVVVLRDENGTLTRCCQTATMVSVRPAAALLKLGRMARKSDEPVRLTRIYTRGGDRGETSLGDGSRVPKLDCRIAAFGTVDELNSLIGLALAAELPAEMRDVLDRVQNELFDVGADISVPFGIEDRLRVSQGQIDALEANCDRFNADLPELKSFVLPGGSDGAARLHVARAVCRRAERDVLDAAGRVELNPLVAVYLNRLSDLLFILARAANPGTEVLWKPGSSR